jgi:flagellar motor switch protein FliM
VDEQVMEKALTQQEIDAMVRAARSGGKVEPQGPPEPKVDLWDARRAGQIGREQLQAINLLHEGFARNLTHSLGAYLRVVFTATLVSAEHLTYREFQQNIPELTYLAACKLEPMGVSGALQLDLKVGFPIVDLLLGGEGRSIAAARDITEIEEQILESVARIVCREMGAAWQAISLEVSLDKRLDTAEAQRLMAPDEKILSLSFEIVMPDVRGGLNLAVPAVVSNALLRKISADWTYRQPRRDAHVRQRLMRRLLDCPFPVELGTKDVRAPVEELSEMVPGKLLTFARSASEPASLLIAGVEMFRAMPARRGNSRAARVLEPCVESRDSSPQAKEKTTK